MAGPSLPLNWRIRPATGSERAFCGVPQRVPRLTVVPLSHPPILANMRKQLQARWIAARRPPRVSQ